MISENRGISTLFPWKTVDNHVDSVEMSKDENNFVSITIYALRISSIYSACPLKIKVQSVANGRIIRLFAKRAANCGLHATIAYVVLRMFMRT